MIAPLSLFYFALCALVALAACAAGFVITRRHRLDDDPRSSRNNRQVQGFPPALGWVERNLFKKLPRFA